MQSPTLELGSAADRTQEGADALSEVPVLGKTPGKPVAAVLHASAASCRSVVTGTASAREMQDLYSGYADAM